MQRDEFVRRAAEIADALADVSRSDAICLLYQAITFSELRPTDPDQEVEAALSSIAVAWNPMAMQENMQTWLPGVMDQMNELLKSGKVSLHPAVRQKD